MRAGPVPRDRRGIFFFQEKNNTPAHPVAPTREHGSSYLNGANIGSLGGEIHLALRLIRTNFQVVEFNFHEAVGLLHELRAINPHTQLFQMMRYQADNITVAGNLIRPLLILILIGGYNLYQQYGLAQTGNADQNITKGHIKRTILSLIRQQ